MRLEIPILKRCCCLPLRRGIIVIGYLSLAISILFAWAQVQFGQSWTEPTIALYRGVGFFAQPWGLVFLYSIDIVFILILLVGAHTRNPRLMLVYYYYGITTALASVPAFLFVTFMDPHSHAIFYLIDTAIVFCALVTQAYLLLLIRSWLEKPQESLRFVNHLSEVWVHQPASGNGYNPL